MFLSAKLSGVDEYVKILKGRKSPCSQLILKNRFVFFSRTEFIYEQFLGDRFVFGIDFAVFLILRVRFFTKRSDQKSGSIGFSVVEKRNDVSKGIIIHSFP